MNINTLHALEHLYIRRYTDRSSRTDLAPWATELGIYRDLAQIVMEMDQHGFLGRRGIGSFAELSPAGLAYVENNLLDDGAHEDLISRNDFVRTELVEVVTQMSNGKKPRLRMAEIQKNLSAGTEEFLVRDAASFLIWQGKLFGDNSLQWLQLP
jgi:hypothetical protein